MTGNYQNVPPNPPSFFVSLSLCVSLTRSLSLYLYLVCGLSACLSLMYGYIYVCVLIDRCAQFTLRVPNPTYRIPPAGTRERMHTVLVNVAVAVSMIRKIRKIQMH